MLFIDMSSTLTDMISRFVSGVPNFIIAIIILLIGLIVSKIASKVIKNLLVKIKVDKLGDSLNEIDFIESTNVKIKLSAVFSKIVYYVLLLFFTIAATDALNMPAVSNLVVGIFNFVPKLIVALIFLIIGILAADAIKSIVLTTCNSLGISSGKIIASFLFYFLLVNIFISALSLAEIETAFLQQNISIVLGGIVLAFAIGYGLASKDSMSNLLASYGSNDKFKIGDTLTIDGDTGKVIDLDGSSVTITSNDRRIVYPLNKVMNSKIEIHN